MNQTNKPFFSIVIPVYNGLTHDLPKCLDSIWKQPIDKSLYEVICVDDCSTDDTHNWLSLQEAEYSNLKILYNKVNIRQGGGRNRGVKEACGEYIVFIDQDDYFHDGAFLKVYKHLQKNKLELLIVDCTYESPGVVGTKLQHNFPHREVMTGDEQIAKNSIPWAPWKFIFQRQLVVDNNLFFNEHERIEDIDWVHRLTHAANVCQYQPILMIHYIKTPISTTMTSFSSPETVFSTLRMSERCFELLDTCFKDSNEKVKKRITQIADYVFFLGLRNYFFLSDKVQKKAKAITDSSGGKDLNLYSKWISKFAISYPLFFSYATNFTSPFARILLKSYRWGKYTIKRLI